MNGELIILNEQGDERVAWDTEDVETVEAAKSRFAEALLEGRLPVVERENGKKELVHAFEPEAGRIVLLPVMVGG